MNNTTLVIGAAAAGLYLWHKHQGTIAAHVSIDTSAGYTGTSTGQVTPSGVAQSANTSLPISNTPMPNKAPRGRLASAAGVPRIAHNGRGGGSPKAADGTLAGGPMRTVAPLTPTQKAAEKAANAAGHALRTHTARQVSPHAAAVAAHRAALQPTGNALGVSKDDVRAAYRDPGSVGAGSPLAPYLTGGDGDGGAPLTFNRHQAMGGMGLLHLPPGRRAKFAAS